MRVVIADDASIVRAGLGAMLAEGGVETVAEVGDPGASSDGRDRGPTRPSSTSGCRPRTPTRASAAARASGDRTPTRGAASCRRPSSRAYAMRLLTRRTPSVGYLLKERVADVAMLVDALQRVVAGESVVDPAIVHACSRACGARTRSTG